ncbi:molybdopterin-binding protein [Litchfieldella anticariensis FP35 = DSM 16096]|uniref:Molybdopterin-binding protein n=1 Tax=Litchfieldella anticariensis (strain DSM 16096 / CECT 5854 / CIP 108499 / LMG 22089 / FP35) TaxID=1121939 RepID=S2KKN8_LITA3|nr:molybdopterin-binding protein [Halomonas anticariensis]EPC00988.1 molybdopterin-binding protein [Halomonas anticariensis FP35 = DSM 16096]
MNEPTDPRRRRFLTNSLLATSAVLLAGCDRLSRSDTMSRLFDAGEALTQRAQRLLASRESLAREYAPKDIAPTFRANGTTNPQNEAYRRLAANGFRDWRLTIDGLVERPQTFSLDELKAMPSRTQITRHDCVEGWSCIGQWTGVVLGDLLAQVGVRDEARFVVFHCADRYHGTDPYYESLDMLEAYHPQTLLAYDLNGTDLPIANGAPLRLRAERQLGYKMAKYVMRVELVESFAHLGRGRGGYWEDRGYQWWAGI